MCVDPRTGARDRFVAATRGVEVSYCDSIGAMFDPIGDSQPLFGKETQFRGVPGLILRLRNLDRAALLKELGRTLRCLKLSDVVPVVRMIRGPFEHGGHLLVEKLFGLVSLFICRLPIG
jgi:hypothetical protein